jgi:hypothetical protein
MRRYTNIDRRAAIDARREAMMQRPVGLRDDCRCDGRLLLEVGGQVFDIELKPDPRDVRRWIAYRSGQPYMRAGLERIWRKVQSEIALPLGRAQWQ